VKERTLVKRKTIELLREAYGKYGIAAFNVFNAEQIHGVFAGASQSARPVILQITPVAQGYMNEKFLEAMINAAHEVYGHVEFSVHLDHGNFESCNRAIETGFYDSVMIDASAEPFEKNIRITSQVVQRAHEAGIAVEAELGILGGKEDENTQGPEKGRYTNPDQAAEFVGRTNCDSLAVAVGTSHGAYKLEGEEGLNFSILERIQTLLPRYPLVLHGASGVPLDEISRINDAGGKLSSKARGITTEQLLEAVRHGITKVNVATDARLLWTRVHREFFKGSPELFDLVLPGRIYMEELRNFVRQKCESLILENHEN